MTGPDALKAARAACDLSQQDIAVALGVSLASVGGWERGINVPRRGMAQRLDELLGADGELLAAFGYALTQPDGGAAAALERRVKVLEDQLREVMKLGSGTADRVESVVVRIDAIEAASAPASPPIRRGRRA